MDGGKNGCVFRQTETVKENRSVLTVAKKSYNVSDELNSRLNTGAGGKGT